MKDFSYYCPTKMIFGKGTENSVGKEVKGYSSKVLLHYGGGSIKKTGLYDRVTTSLKESGVEFVELGGAQPNPVLGLVRKGIKICRDNNINFVLAIGGGSAIDSAKAIAVGVPYPGDVWDLYAGYKGSGLIKEALSVGAIVTIPAAGSEMSKNSVITKEEGLWKRSIATDLIRPKFAILNPELTYSLPTYQTFSGITDIFMHISERYFTNVPNVDFTDKMCEGALKNVVTSARKILKNPTDYDARADIMLAAAFAHNDFFGMGRDGDWTSHRIEHEISGIYNVAHGAGLSAIYSSWAKYVYKDNVDRFVQFAEKVWGVQPDQQNPENTALEGIERMTNFFKEIGMPINLQELNVPDDRFEEMANKADEATPLGSIKKIFREDIINILNLSR